MVVSKGSTVNSEGAQYGLAGGSGSTVYIRMFNLEASRTGTSFYTYLEILKPNTTTYVL
jgi:hypothetical protein